MLLLTGSRPTFAGEEKPQQKVLRKFYEKLRLALGQIESLYYLGMLLDFEPAFETEIYKGVSMISYFLSTKPKGQWLYLGPLRYFVCGGREATAKDLEKVSMINGIYRTTKVGKNLVY